MISRIHTAPLDHHPFFSAETTITIGVQAPTGIHGENYTLLYLQWQKPRLQSMYKHLKIEVSIQGKAVIPF